MAVGHDRLAKAFASGYVPEVRVWLQEIGPDGRAGNLFRLLEVQTHVSTHREVAGGGSAVIALSNRDDRFFRKKYRRAVSLGSSGVDYVTDVLGQLWRYVRPVNPDRAQRSAFEGVRSFATPADIDDYIHFLYDFTGVHTRGVDNQPGVAGGGGVVGPEARGSGRTVHDRDLVDLGLMQRVAIDARDPDGQWCAWFTGVVTGIEDGYRVRDVPTIAIRCRDYSRLLQLSEIALRAGPAYDLLSNLSLELRLQSELQGGGAEGLVRFCTALADLSGSQILHMILDIVNRTYCWLPYAMERLGLDAYRYDAASLAKSGVTVPGDLKRDDFFHDEGFWYVPFFNRVGDVPATHLGQDTLRRRVGQIHAYGPRSIEGGGATVSKPARASDGESSFPVAALDSTLLVDANILSGHQGQAYRFLIDNLLGFYQVDRVTSDQVVRKVADATFYDIFFDGNGSLVYQIPKYNNLPGDYSVTFEQKRLVSTAFALNRDELAANQIPVSNDAFQIPETATVKYGTGMQPSGGFHHFDYAPSGEVGQNFAWQHHGFGYVITSTGFRSRRLSSSEEPIVTDVEVPAGFNILKLDANLEARYATGRTPFNQVRRDQARFGHRFLRSSQIIIPKEFGSNLATIGPVLDAFAMALMQQLNGRAVTGTIELSSRSDLDVGLTALLLERQHVFMILAIDQQVRYGKGADATTTLTLGFGHDVGQQYPNPWTAAGLALASTRAQSNAGAVGTAASGVSASAGVAFGSSPVESAAPVRTGVGNYEPRTPGAPLRGLADLRRRVAAASSRPLTSTRSVSVSTKPNVRYIDADVDTLVAQARLTATAVGMTIKAADEYSLARAIASEAGTDVLEQIVVGYNALFRFKKSTITRGLTTSPTIKRGRREGGPDGCYANQQDGRFESTERDPTGKHLAVAQAVLRGEVAAPIPPGGGYFSPSAQRRIRQTLNPSQLSSIALVKRRWGPRNDSPGQGWLKVDGLDTGRFFVFAPKFVNGKNVYGVRSLEEAIAEVSRWDAAP